MGACVASTVRHWQIPLLKNESILFHSYMYMRFNNALAAPKKKKIQASMAHTMQASTQAQKKIPFFWTPHTQLATFMAGPDFPSHRQRRLVELLLHVGLDGAVGGGVGDAGEDEAVAHLVGMQAQ